MRAVATPRHHRFTRREYDRIVESGVFGPMDHLELLDGEIIDMSPQKSRHATAVTLVSDALRTGFDADATIRVQLPFNLDERSVPEPDCAVVPGSPRTYRDAHPEQALLICEVADTTLDYDRGRKLRAYARASIPEYWILDLNAETFEVCREPDGTDYHARLVLGRDASIAPIARPDHTIAVADLLP